MTEVNINPLKHQYDFVTSMAPTTVMLGGRGCGKSAGIGMLTAVNTTKLQNGIHIAPTYKTLTEVTKESIDHWLRAFGISYEFNKSEMRYDIAMGGYDLKVLLVSGENPERLRGLTNFHYLCIDEAPLCSEDVLRLGKPCLRGQRVIYPRVYIASTPRGTGNWVSKLVTQPKTNYIVAKTSDNPHNGPDFYNEMLELYKDMPEFALQELEGVILDSNLNSLFRDEHWTKFISNPEVYGDWYAGLDVAGCGEDYSVLTLRQGKVIKEMHKIRTPELDDLCKFVLTHTHDKQLKSIAIDSTGIGAFVPAEIRKMMPTTKVIPVNFGASSISPNYSNRRSEIHFNLRKAIDNGLCLRVADSSITDELKQEFFAVEMDLDSSRRFKLTPKNLMRKKITRSPDCLDSLCLACVESTDPYQSAATQSLLLKTSNPFSNFNWS